MIKTNRTPKDEDQSRMISSKRWSLLERNRLAGGDSKSISLTSSDRGVFSCRVGYRTVSFSCETRTIDSSVESSCRDKPMTYRLDERQDNGWNRDWREDHADESVFDERCSQQMTPEGPSDRWRSFHDSVCEKQRKLSCPADRRVNRSSVFRSHSIERENNWKQLVIDSNRVGERREVKRRDKKAKSHTIVEHTQDVVWRNSRQTGRSGSKKSKEINRNLRFEWTNRDRFSSPSALYYSWQRKNVGENIPIP